MAEKHKSFWLYPYYAYQTFILRAMVRERCHELRASAKECVPENVLTQEIIGQYIKAGFSEAHLEKAIRDNRWHEGFDVVCY